MGGVIGWGQEAAAHCMAPRSTLSCLSDGRVTPALITPQGCEPHEGECKSTLRSRKTAPMQSIFIIIYTIVINSNTAFWGNLKWKKIGL